MTSRRILDGIKNMLTKRGCSQFTDIESKLGPAMTATDSKGEIIVVLLPRIKSEVPDKILNEFVHYLYFLMETYESSHAVVAYNNIAPTAADILSSHQIYRTELFKYKYLFFDPTEHQIVPTHTLLTNTQIKEELGDIEKRHLPCILSTDRIIRFYDWKVGKIIRIERPDGYYYRVIVAA